MVWICQILFFSSSVGPKDSFTYFLCHFCPFDKFRPEFCYKGMLFLRFFELFQNISILAYFSSVFDFWPKKFQKQQMLKTQTFFSELQICSKTPQKIFMTTSRAGVPLSKILGGGKISYEILPPPPDSDLRNNVMGWCVFLFDIIVRVCFKKMIN